MHLRIACCIIVAMYFPASQGGVPKPVTGDYPGLTSVSSFLATKFEAENLLKAGHQATDMILVAALAEETTADVVSKAEAKIPFGGFEIPVEDQVYEKGRLYILCGLVEQRAKSYAASQMDPWPMWQLVCGKLFKADEGKIFSIRYISPHRTVPHLSEGHVSTVVQKAVVALNALPQYQAKGAVHKLVAVVSVESQTVDEKYFGQLALAQIPNDVQVFYVYFLTCDTTDVSAPAILHAAAVMRTPGQLKVVRQIEYGEPGFTVLRAHVGLDFMTTYSFDQHAQAKFRVGVAEACRYGMRPEDVQITNTGSLDMRHAQGTKVDFTLSVRGSAKALIDEMKAPGFHATLATAFHAAGMHPGGSIPPKSVTFSHEVVRTNESSGTNAGTFSLLQVLVIIGSFVLGVIVTTLVGVLGLAKSRHSFMSSIKPGYQHGHTMESESDVVGSAPHTPDLKYQGMAT